MTCSPQYHTTSSEGFQITGSMKYSQAEYPPLVGVGDEEEGEFRDDKKLCWV